MLVPTLKEGVWKEKKGREEENKGKRRSIKKFEVSMIKIMLQDIISFI